MGVVTKNTLKTRRESDQRDFPTRRSTEWSSPPNVDLLLPSQWKSLTVRQASPRVSWGVLSPAAWKIVHDPKRKLRKTGKSMKMTRRSEWQLIRFRLAMKLAEQEYYTRPTFYRKVEGKYIHAFLNSDSTGLILCHTMF